nr:cystin-1 isoform X2 [Macaca fascicularis]
MGSGSSRSGRTLRRRRSPESLPAGPGAAALEGGTGRRMPVAAAEAPGAAAEAASGRDPSPVAPPDGRDETLRLLDQLLAESAAWGPPEPAPRRPARPRPTAVAGSAVSAEQSTEGHPGSGSVSEAARNTYCLQCLRGQAVCQEPCRRQQGPHSCFCTPAAGGDNKAPGSSGKKPERPAAISYDHAEEGLMASIEREYCR